MFAYDNTSKNFAFGFGIGSLDVSEINRYLNTSLNFKVNAEYRLYVTDNLDLSYGASFNYSKPKVDKVVQQTTSFDSLNYFLLEVKGLYKVNSKVNFISGINFPLYLPVGVTDTANNISGDLYLKGTLGFLVGVSFNTSPNTEVSLTYNHIGYIAPDSDDQWEGFESFSLGANYLF